MKICALHARLRLEEKLRVGRVAAARAPAGRPRPATPATLGLWVVQAVESPATFPDPCIPLALMMRRIA